MVTTYETLKSHLASLLWRTNLTTQIPVFIQQAEARFKRDPRVRKHQDRGLVTIGADDLALPSDFQSLESWYHDGTSYYGEIGIVSASAIPGLKIQHGATGVPWFAAIVDGTVRFAPEPNGTYSTYMTYWRTIQSLSASVPTNWLLDSHPDIYVYGAALESAPFLKNDDRLAVWDALLERRLNELDEATTNRHFGGGATRRRITPIG